MEVFYILISIGIGVILVMYVYNKAIKPTKNEINANLTKEYVSYNNSAFTLVLKERNQAIAKVVKIKNDKNFTVAYEPEKIHFGAATVGGITTGGAYTTGGYHYISSSEKNGLCVLEYAGNFVSKIQLDDSLYRLAKESAIEKYLNSDKQIQVVDPVYFSESEIQRMHSNLSSSGYMNMGSDLMRKGKQGYPTYEKCLEIMNWICGANN